MNAKLIVRAGIVALALVLVLFEVRFDVRLALPAELEQVDPDQEARYLDCYEARDREIHDTAFGTIDNPDVQKLYIINNRKTAVTACRAEYPERSITVRQPFEFNLVDLRFRYR